MTVTNLTNDQLAYAIGISDADEPPTATLQVAPKDVQLGDLLMGYWVTGVSQGRHDGHPARTFQLGSPMTPNGEMTVGRLTLMEGADNTVIVVRDREHTWAERYEQLPEFFQMDDSKAAAEKAEEAAIELCGEMYSHYGEADGTLLWHALMGMDCQIKRVDLKRVERLAVDAGFKVGPVGEQPEDTTRVRIGRAG